MAAAVRCAPPANKPLPSERDNCLPYAARGAGAAARRAVVVCLGRLRLGRRLPAARGCGREPRFGHGAEHALPSGGPVLLGSYHPSQQNTFTGRLTEQMMDAVFVRARELAGVAAS